MQTGADGRYTIPRLDDLPEGASARIRRFTLVVYHRGHVGWRSDRVFPGQAVRRDFSQRGNRVRLDRWQPAYRHATHLVFLGGGAKVRLAAAWELQAAALELDGERLPLSAPGEGRGGGAGRAADAARHLEAAQRRRDPRRHRLRRQVRGRQADRPADDRVLRQPPLQGARQARELRRRPARLAARPGGLRGSVQQAHDHAARARTPRTRWATRSFRAQSGEIGGLVFLVRERGVVVSMTCGSGQCPEPAQLAKLAKLVESRLPELPPEQPRLAPPAPEAAAAQRRRQPGREADAVSRGSSP